MSGCNNCNKKKLNELSSDEKTKIKVIIKLVDEGKLQQALEIAESLSLEARMHIPDSVLFKFSNMEENLNEMSSTGGAAFTTPGSGEGMATKKAFKKMKVRKPKYFQNKKNKNKPFSTKLSSLLYEINELQHHNKKDIFLKIKIKGDKFLAARPAEFSDQIYYNLCAMYQVDPAEFFAWRNETYGSRAGSEPLQEGLSYNKFKSQAKTKNNQATFHSAVKEIKKKLSEVNRILEFTNKMRHELSEDKALKYSRFTEKALGQLTTMIAELYGNLKQLKK